MHRVIRSPLSRPARHVPSENKRVCCRTVTAIQPPSRRRRCLARFAERVPVCFARCNIDFAQHPLGAVLLLSSSSGCIVRPSSRDQLSRSLAQPPTPFRQTTLQSILQLG
jgi:hypothetical protein